MKNYHDVRNPKFEGDFLVITINGEEKRFQLREISSVLEKATDKERIKENIRWKCLDLIITTPKPGMWIPAARGILRCGF